MGFGRRCPASWVLIGVGVMRWAKYIPETTINQNVSLSLAFLSGERIPEDKLYYNLFRMHHQLLPIKTTPTWFKASSNPQEANLSGTVICIRTINTICFRSMPSNSYATVVRTMEDSVESAIFGLINPDGNRRVRLFGDRCTLVYSFSPLYFDGICSWIREGGSVIKDVYF